MIIRYKVYVFFDPSKYKLAGNNAVLQLGRGYGTSKNEISNIVIANNIFDKPNTAIKDTGASINNLIVHKNIFGAFYTAIHLGGFTNSNSKRFLLENSIITNNIFKPGSYIDVDIVQGTIASQIGGSRRLDFSDNVADGTSIDYLYSDKKNEKGWRLHFLAS